LGCFARKKKKGAYVFGTERQNIVALALGLIVFQ
jgi:hypothetical protein